MERYVWEEYLNPLLGTGDVPALNYTEGFQYFQDEKFNGNLFNLNISLIRIVVTLSNVKRHCDLIFNNIVAEIMKKSGIKSVLELVDKIRASHSSKTIEDVEASKG